MKTRFIDVEVRINHLSYMRYIGIPIDKFLLSKSFKHCSYVYFYHILKLKTFKHCSYVDSIHMKILKYDENFRFKNTLEAKFILEGDFIFILEGKILFPLEGENVLLLKRVLALLKGFQRPIYSSTTKYIKKSPHRGSMRTKMSS